MIIILLYLGIHHLRVAIVLGSQNYSYISNIIHMPLTYLLDRFQLDYLKRLVFSMGNLHCDSLLIYLNHDISLSYHLEIIKKFNRRNEREKEKERERERERD